MNLRSYALLTGIVLLALVACTQADSTTQTKTVTPEEAQKTHAKLIQLGFPGQIQEQLAHTQGDVHLRTGTVHELGVGLPLEAELANLSCQSDLVIVAKAIQGTSHATADQGYIYSEWTFGVEQVLQNNPKARVRPGTDVVVIRPGGMLELGGRKVYAKPDYFRDFKPGEDLLLYLHFVRETRAYLMREPNLFPISDDTLTLARAGVKSAATDSHCGGSR